MKRFFSVKARKLSMLLALFALVACAPKQQEVVDLAWPLPPEQPRIKYLDTFEGPQSVVPHRFLDFIFGQPPQKFMRPSGVAADAAGSIYVVDAVSIIMLDKQAQRYDVISGKGAARIINATAVAVSSDGKTLYVADNKADRVFGMDVDGNLKVLFGGSADELSNPLGLALDEKLRRLYVADGKKHRILAYDLQGKLLHTIGGPGGDAGRLNIPFSLAINSEGNIYVTDMGNFRVQVFSPEGKFLSTFGTIGDSPGQFQRPKGIAIDRHDNVYVVDNVFNNVQVFDKKHNLLLVWGQAGYKAGEVVNPVGIHIDARDRIYLVSQVGRRVNVYQLLPESPGGK